jgi:hypothetical protein
MSCDHCKSIRADILDQMEDAGILAAMNAGDRELMLKLLVWDERIVDEHGKIVR